ncbi:Peflin [Larimichthys crocea]|uniref:Uncharacterized protein n=1 Tax=Larimichthys crocea TaxID=215358 RepID=A0ACD3RGR5_LARCR|nr:Peflin [Larimichthys crocea]
MGITPQLHTAVHHVHKEVLMVVMEPQVREDSTGLGLMGVTGDSLMEDNTDTTLLQVTSLPVLTKRHTSGSKLLTQDHSGFINIKELKQALVNSNWSSFNDETCLMMINMFDKTRSGRIDLVRLLCAVGLHAEVESTFSAVRQRPLRLYQWHGATTSPRSDGLQPEPTVFGELGAALHHARTTRHPSGPLHPGVHPAPDHDTGLQGERHGHDGQHPPQL